jgi:surface carbohydrate biosynthesis protein
MLATELAGHGFTSIIGYKGAVSRAMGSARRPGVLFYKNYRKSRWSDLVGYSVGQDPEAGITYRDFADFYAWRSGLQMAETSDAYFCYGPDDHNFLAEALPQAKLHMTGSPRATLWGPQGKIFHAGRIEEIKQHYGSFILFANSGGRGNPRLERGRRSGSMTPEKGMQLAENLRTADEMAAAAFTVAAELGKQVVVRPHPVEDWAAWQQAVEGMERVNVESCFDLAPWVHAAEAVVHYTSTAALEAFSAGTPAIAFAATEGAFSDGYLARLVSVPNDLSIKAFGTRALLDVIANVAEEQDRFLKSGDAERLMQRKLYEPPGGSAASMASVIAGLGDYARESGVHVPPPGRWWSRLRREHARQIPRIGDGLPPRFKRRPITRHEIESDVDAALDVLGRERGCVIPIMLEEDCYAITAAC